MWKLPSMARPASSRISKPRALSGTILGNPDICEGHQGHLYNISWDTLTCSAWRHHSKIHKKSLRKNAKIKQNNDNIRIDDSLKWQVIICTATLFCFELLPFLFLLTKSLSLLFGFFRHQRAGLINDQSLFVPVPQDQAVLQCASNMKKQRKGAKGAKGTSISRNFNLTRSIKKPFCSNSGCCLCHPSSPF